MTLTQLIYGVMKGLHDVFTVVWIGGLFISGLVVQPVLKQNLENGQQLKRIMSSFQARFRKITGISILGLLITGVYLSRMQPEFFGMFNFGNSYSTMLSIKIIIVLMMIGIMIVSGLLLKKQVNNFELITKSLMMSNMVLGLVVLLISGFLAV